MVHQLLSRAIFDEMRMPHDDWLKGVSKKHHDWSCLSQKKNVLIKISFDGVMVKVLPTDMTSETIFMTISHT